MLDIHANKIIANKFVGEFENNNNDSISIGMIIPFASNGDIPNGFLLCNGTSVLRSTYPDLFNAIGTTYGAVDSDHFNLPNLIGRFAEGADNAGISKEAGLPNIEGDPAYTDDNSSSYSLKTDNPTGAFVKKQINANPINSQNTSVTTFHTGVFDASAYNPIYGNSDTVQPPSLTVRYIIKAFAGAPSSTTDLEITQLANDLADKANRDLSNLTEVGKKALGSTIVESRVNDEGSWYRVYSNGFIEQGGKNICNARTGTHIVTLLKPFSNTKYIIITNTRESISSGYQICIYTRTTTTFDPYYYQASGNASYDWYACGQGAEE